MREIRLDEEIKEFTHPEDPTIIVGYAVPDRMEGIKRSAETGKIRVEPLLGPDGLPIIVNGKPATREVFERAPIEKVVAQLGEIIRYVKGIDLVKGGVPYVPKDNAEWARVIMRKEFDYDRDDPVEARLDETDTPRDPDTDQRLSDEQVRIWQDPGTYSVALVMWDPAADAPLRRKRRHTFWEALLDRSIRRGTTVEEVEEGKETPALQSVS